MSAFAIFYEAEAYTLAGDIKGRHAAGAAFLRAIAESEPETVWCYSGSRRSAEDLAQQLTNHGSDAGVVLVPFDRPDGLAEPGLLHRPDPGIGQHAWQRLTRCSPRAYSLTGVTHTTASHGAMEAIAGLLTAPVEDWDALICTSRAVRDSVRFILEAQAEYLRDRLGATRLTIPQLPIIPLGVHTGDYAFTSDDRERARAALHVADDEVIILYVGRLSFHAKAHPLPMYLGVEACTPGRKIVLIQAGWFANDVIEQAFKADAAALCPSVRCLYVDGRDQVLLRQAWAAADIFTSMSDNFQETFGLSPLEAMASGLPVVVSDWDGYRDTVRDGVDGFRVPTLTLPAGSGGDLADLYDLGIHNYDRYSAHTSQVVAVHVQAAADAYRKLLDDSALRKRMGEAGRSRARAEFDWTHVFGQYISLWEELGERRRAGPQLHPPLTRRRRADRADPFSLFASYSTEKVGPDLEIRRLEGITFEQCIERRELQTVRYSALILPSPDLIAAVLSQLQAGEWERVRDLASAFPPHSELRVVRAVVWLAKVGAVSFRRAS